MPLSQRDYTHGFWCHRPDEAFPPQGISDPGQYTGESTLSIIGAGYFVKPAEQTKITKRWQEILPSLHNVRALWVSVRVSQAVFDAICEMKGLEALWIKSNVIKSLYGISKLKHLQSLHLGHSPQLVSLEPLCQLQQLQWLEMEGVKKIDNLSSIGKCHGLHGLGIEGTMSVTQQVQSLAPVGNLTELRYLNIANLRAADKSLKPLYPLHKLQRLHAATWWNAEEIATLKHHNPPLAAQ